MADHNQNNHNEEQPGEPRFHNDEVDDALQHYLSNHIYEQVTLPHQVTHHYNNYEHHVQQQQQYCNHDQPQHHCQIIQTIYGQQYYYNGQNHNLLLKQQQPYLHDQQQQHVQQIQHDHGQQQHMQLYYNDHDQNHNVQQIQTNHGQQYYNNGLDHQDRQNHNHIFPGQQPQQQQQQRQGGERELTDEEFDAYFPKGMRFCPTDEELLKYYLHRKANNIELPRNRIREVMLYQHHPKTLTDMHKMHTENVWYFFTLRTRKYPNGSRPDRKVCEHGYWKATGDEKPVGHPIVYGYKMALDFYEGKLPKDKTDWKMIEFTVEKTSKLPTLPKSKSSSPYEMKLNGWALCKVYINSRAKKKDVAVPIANECDGQGSSLTPTDPFTSGSAHYNHNSYSSSSASPNIPMGQTLDSHHHRTSPIGAHQQSQPFPTNTGPVFEYPISSSRVGSDLNYEQGLPTSNDETSNAFYPNDHNLEFKYSGEP